jgi:hypothetical protein
MVMKTGEILAIISAIVLAIAIVVSIVAVVYYVDLSIKGTFNIAITDKNKSNGNPDLPLNTFQAGQSFELGIWVSGHTNPFLTNTITLSNGPFGAGNGLTCTFTDYSGNVITQGTIPAGNSGFGCYLVVKIAANAPAGSYNVYAVGTDNSGIEHQDGYSFTVIP